MPSRTPAPAAQKRLPRRKPVSAKQKRVALQEKRAVKRGDLPPPDASEPSNKKGGRNLHSRADPSAAASSQAARKLQSAFVRVGADFLEQTKVRAAAVPLPRPLPPDTSVFPFESDDSPGVSPPGATAQLSAPRRPKWRFDMSKKEVEKNEEGLFAKWIAQADAVVDDWRNAGLEPDTSEDAPPEEASPTTTPDLRAPRAPAHFERNLEVWRQLWRVTEISQILLILVDARCASLHFPPALSAHLAGLRNKRLVLVLTKVDIAGRARTDAWAAHLRARHPGVRVAMVEAYAPPHAGKRAREPHLPPAFRAALVATLRGIHAEMLQPPERIRDDPAKVARWRPPVKRVVDWEAVLSARGGQVGHAVGGATAPQPASHTDEGAEDRDDDTEQPEPEHLTIGLIGQPNVGKSSLLNALFGVTKVRASSTPGKTKHFQTLFWTPEVRLVDCPGLVFPNLVPMELQVLSGILPIARVAAVPACIHYAAQLLPLERILKLTHPTAAEAPSEDKRTWREGHPRAAGAAGAVAPEWTAMDVLTAYANAKGWVTAKAGRPDVNRAGNALLRALADGRIRWAFWPPGTAPDAENADGIWLDADADNTDIASVVDSDSDADSDSGSDGGETPADGTDSEEDDEEDAAAFSAKLAGASKFGALDIEGDEEDEDDEVDGALVVSSKPATSTKFAALEVEGGEDDGDGEEESG